MQKRTAILLCSTVDFCPQSFLFETEVSSISFPFVPYAVANLTQIKRFARLRSRIFLISYNDNGLETDFMYDEHLDENKFKWKSTGAGRERDAREW